MCGQLSHINPIKILVQSIWGWVQTILTIWSEEHSSKTAKIKRTNTDCITPHSRITILSWRIKMGCCDHGCFQEIAQITFFFLPNSITKS